MLRTVVVVGGWNDATAARHKQAILPLERSADCTVNVFVESKVQEVRTILVKLS